MIFDIIRFNTYAVDVLDDANYATITIGEYLSEHGYSKSFCDDYLIPMTAAVWSTSPEKASLEFPAQTLIRFLWNHHLLSTIAARPDWLTIPGGSQRYIDTITKAVDSQLKVHLGSAVLGVVRPPPLSNQKVRLFSEYEEWEFDHVILACHGKILSAVPFSVRTCLVYMGMGCQNDSSTFEYIEIVSFVLSS
jgi:predicted NAD/FAD-binding protein